MSVAPAGPDFRVNTWTTSNQYFSNYSLRTAAMDADGDFVIAWSGFTPDSGSNDIFAQRYNSAGVPQGSEFRVNTYTTDDQYPAGVSMDADGDFVVLWSSYRQDGSSGGVYARRYDAAGTPQGIEFRVNTYVTNSQQYAMAAMEPDGDFVISYMSSTQDGDSLGTYARRYGADGVPKGTEFRVNTYTAGQQTYPAVAVSPTGDFVVTWASPQDGSLYGIYAQRYNSAGVAQGSEFRVNTYTTGLQTYPTVAVNTNGEFIIAWTDSNQAGLRAQRYASDGAPIGSEFQALTANTNGTAAFAANGDLIITASLLSATHLDVWARRYNSAGVLQGSEFRINSYATGAQRYGSVAVDNKGDFVIAWMSADQDGDLEGIYARRYVESTDTARPFVTGSYVVDPAGTPVTRVLAQSSREVSSISQISLAFSENLTATGAGSATSAANWRLERNGTDVASEISQISFGLNPLTNRYEALLTFAAPLQDGEYTLTARSTLQDLAGNALSGNLYGGAQADYVHNFAVKRTLAVGPEFQVNTYTTSDQSAPAVATDAAGNYVVVWASNLQDGNLSGIYAQRYTASGVKSGSEFRVNTYTTGTQAEPVVAVDSDGDFVVAWSGSGPGDSAGIFTRRFNAAGTALGSDVRINSFTTGVQSLPSMATNASGEFVLAWESSQDGSGTSIITRKYNSGGFFLTTELAVNSYVTGNQSAPSVAIDSHGAFVVAWQSDQDGDAAGIYLQRFGADNSKQGAEIRANLFTTGAQSRPAISADSVGNFIVVWDSAAQDGNSDGVFAQRYSSQGTVFGSEFRINTETSAAQRIPSVSLDADGDTVIAWQSLNQDGNLEGVFAQRFDALGVAQQTELRVNSYTTGDQSAPAVAMDSDGDFVVAWQSAGQDGSGSGVFAQRFASTPPLQVVTLIPTTAGFTIDFNRAFDPSTLNLYDQGGLLGAADVTITGQTSGEVRGSVVLGGSADRLVFIKSGATLAPDVYTVQLRSDSLAFRDTTGRTLDGNSDGTTGDNYTGGFTVAPAPAAITLRVPDFARGAGQTVTLNPSASGVPITISNALGVQSASFKLNYDPNLLTISGATLGAGITGSLTIDTSVSGVAQISVSAASSLGAASGSQTLVTLMASVPNTAPYASKQILDLSNIQLLDSSSAALTSRDDDGLHIAAYLGDANASQTYNSPDSTLAQRLIVGINTGLIEYPLADPNLIVDVTNNGVTQSDDVTLIQRAIVGLPTSEIPLLPGLAPVASGGPDPLVSIPQSLTATVGSTLRVPIELLVTEPTGITLSGADLVVAYDAAKFELSDVELGSLLVGFGLNANTSTQGLVRLSMSGGGSLSLPNSATGTLAVLNFAVLGGVDSSSSFNLLESANGFSSALYDHVGRPLTLLPAPTNRDDDAVDGHVQIVGPPGPDSLAAAAVDSLMSDGRDWDE